MFNKLGVVYYPNAELFLFKFIASERIKGNIFSEIYALQTEMYKDTIYYFA